MKAIVAPFQFSVSRFANNSTSAISMTFNNCKLFDPVGQIPLKDGQKGTVYASCFIEKKDMGGGGGG